MGMSMHVIGFAPPDDVWKRHKAVWDACKAAGVDAPAETGRFFGYQDPDPSGVEKDIPHREWQDDMRDGFEIDVASIPEGIKSIRFYCSW